MQEIISDISQLIIGKRYVVQTDEPHGTFYVGRFVGWQIPIGPDGSHLKEPLSITVLPDGWQNKYPISVFEHGYVDDYFMFYGWLEDGS